MCVIHNVLCVVVVLCVLGEGGIHHVRHFLNLFFNPTPDLDYFRDLRDNFQSRYSQMQLGRSGGAGRGGGRGEGERERERECVRACVWG